METSSLMNSISTWSPISKKILTAVTIISSAFLITGLVLLILKTSNIPALSLTCGGAAISILNIIYFAVLQMKKNKRISRPSPKKSVPNILLFHSNIETTPERLLYTSALAFSKEGVKTMSALDIASQMTSKFRRTPTEDEINQIIDYVSEITKIEDIIEQIPVHFRDLFFAILQIKNTPTYFKVILKHAAKALAFKIFTNLDKHLEPCLSLLITSNDLKNIKAIFKIFGQGDTSSHAKAIDYLKIIYNIDHNAAYSAFSSFLSGLNKSKMQLSPLEKANAAKQLWKKNIEINSDFSKDILLHINKDNENKFYGAVEGLFCFPLITTEEQFKDFLIHAPIEILNLLYPSFNADQRRLMMLNHQIP